MATTSTTKKLTDTTTGDIGTAYSNIGDIGTAYSNFTGSTGSTSSTGTSSTSSTGSTSGSYGSTGSTITYDDFLNAANSSGLLGEFSQWDLQTAQSDPSFGMSILGYKQGIHAADTAEQKQMYNTLANNLRSQYGYTGGSTGSDYLSTGPLATDENTTRQNVLNYEAPDLSAYNTMANDLLNQAVNYGSFSYADAPTYTNPYADTQAQLLDAIINREAFSYDKDTDPVWQSYKKQYRREGDRATAEALGQAAAATGGQVSSYAANAATQAGGYYASQLADKIPELYQQAYDRYLDEYSLKQQDLSAVNTQQQLDYSEFLNELSQYNTDRTFAYNQYTDDYNRILSNLAAAQGERESQTALADDEFQRLLSKWDVADQAKQTQYGYLQDEYEKQQAAQETAYQQALNAIALGVDPGEALSSQSGVSADILSAMAGVNADETAYNRQINNRALVEAMYEAGLTPSAELLASAGLSDYGTDMSGLAGYYADESAYQKQQSSQQTYLALVESMYKMGLTPSASLLAAAGLGSYSGDVSSLANAAAAQLNGTTSSGSSSSSSGSSSSSSKKSSSSSSSKSSSSSGSSSSSSSAVRTKYTNLSYDQDEGTFVWNGKEYSNLSKLTDDINSAGLTDAEMSIIQSKFKMYDLDKYFN